MASNRGKIFSFSKPAFKFQFTCTLDYLTVSFKEKWRPKQLQVTWCRGERKKSYPVVLDESQCESKEDADGQLGDEFKVTWPEHEGDSLYVTLYKDSKGVSFKKKEYLFILEDVLGPSRKRLAIFPCNIAEYVSMDYESHLLDIEFKTLSSKLGHVEVGVQIRCQFLKSGFSSDSDMESNFSHVSELDEAFRDLAGQEADEDADAGRTETEESSSSSSTPDDDVGRLMSRANQTISRFMADLNEIEGNELLRYNNLPNFAQAPRSDEPKNNNNNNKSPKSMKKLKDKSVRRRVTAVTTEKVATDRRRRSTKDEVTLPPCATLPASFDGVRTGVIRQLSDNEVAAERVLKMKTLELDNQALSVKNSHLVALVKTLQRDIDDLQAEVGELQMLVEDLRSKLRQTEADHVGYVEINKEVAEKMKLCGWLFKRGVKYGLLGRRWRKRWFTLEEDGRLYYFKKNQSSIPQGFIELDRILGVENLCPYKQDKNSGSFNIITDGRVYVLMAVDDDEKLRWINTLDYLRTWRTHHRKLTMRR